MTIKQVLRLTPKGNKKWDAEHNCPLSSIVKMTVEGNQATVTISVTRLGVMNPGSDTYEVVTRSKDSIAAIREMFKAVDDMHIRNFLGTSAPFIPRTGAVVGPIS